MNRHVLVACLFLMTGMVSCGSLRRKERDVSSSVPQVVQMAAENRQVTAFGTLVAPLLFLMGTGSLVSMLPQMFQHVMRGVGPNLLQLLNPNRFSITGGSSRLKRSAEALPLLTDDFLDEIERRLNLALLETERPIN